MCGSVYAVCEYGGFYVVWTINLVTSDMLCWLVGCLTSQQHASVS